MILAYHISSNLGVGKHEEEEFILILAGAAWRPETKGVDFSEDVQEVGETADRASETSARTTTGADRTAGGS